MSSTLDPEGRQLIQLAKLAEQELPRDGERIRQRVLLAVGAGASTAASAKVVSASIRAMADANSGGALANAGHAAAGDLRRSMQIDAEGIDDRERIVGKKLATEFVARKGVAVDECDGVAAPRQQRGQRRAARAGTDDCDICVNLRHLRITLNLLFTR